MEELDLSKLNAGDFQAAFRGKRVLITGHTGFKGSWLALWLSEIGAEVTGYALAPPTTPSLFECARVSAGIRHIVGDVRDRLSLDAALQQTQPEFVFHLAAQALVRYSYEHPAETFETNFNGTMNLLDAIRSLESVRVCVVVTSDKCYENREWSHAYRETDAMGGFDPYSASKGATELLVASWRRTFFPPDRIDDHGVALATARAGNVIGGGDWARDRIMVDCVQALIDDCPVKVRNPRAVRPWQHVLEPLGGYLHLAHLLRLRPGHWCEAWNFGPEPSSHCRVQDIVELAIAAWGRGSWAKTTSTTSTPSQSMHEAGLLSLDCTKANLLLGWSPRWSLDRCIRATVDWYRHYASGNDDLRAVTLAQIDRYARALPPGVTPAPRSESR